MSGIGERGDVAGVERVGDRGENAPHDLSGPGLWHVGNDVHSSWAGAILPIIVSIVGDHLVGDLLASAT